jgi:steroid delta-isomerase-like uncharacterized protein
MSGENQALARRFFQSVWNERQPELLDELLTPASVCQSEAGVVRGKEEFLNQVYHPFLAAFPDLHIEIEETIAERDLVAVRWLCTGTHTGTAFGLAPTGRRVSFRGTSWIRIQNGKMMEGFECWNLGGLMQVLSGGPPTAAMSVV